MFLLLGIAALFLPATALQNSIAMAQEFYPEYEENEYYNDQEGYDPYKNNNDNKAPVINVEKKLFICNNAIDNSTFFACPGLATEFFGYPAGPDSGDYIPCNDEICFINESDFNAQIFKEVVTIRGLSPEGTPVNLDKFHYTVTESEIADTINSDFECSPVGFRHQFFFEKVIGDNDVFYQICVNYVGDCEGTAYPGEEKTCTIENYLYFGEILPIVSSQTEDNAADTSEATLQQSNNQAGQYHFKNIKDVMNNRVN